MALTRLAGVVILFTCLDASGDLRFANYYGDHMVLQRAPERAVVWGYGPSGDQVSVSLTGPGTYKTQAVSVAKGHRQSGEGIWRVTLDPVEAGGPYNITVTLRQDVKITLTDVLFGDIWLCAGQSNMEFEMYKIFNASEELDQAANYSQVRFFMAGPRHSKTELSDLAAVRIPWSVPTAVGLSDFSAVCWLFGRYLYDRLQHPVGLVEACWGGTPVEAWSSPRALGQCGLKTETSSWIGLGDWGMPLGIDITDLWKVYFLHHRRPGQRNSDLWNGMIHPLLPMTLKGAIWYQGEANAEYNEEKYSCSFPAMIADWRRGFHRASGGQTAPDFPFGFVQLSTFTKGSGSESFPKLRWHQTADTGHAPNQRMNRTFMAVAMDLPDETSPYHPIHPRDKQDVAYRLALGARAVAYGEEGVAFHGPFPDQIYPTQTDLNITYDQTISVSPSEDIFEICCTKDLAPCCPRSPWVPAPIMQWGPTFVQVSTAGCQPAVRVAGLRYAWRDWPCDFKACPIYSASRVLPAPPFKTLQWPGMAGL